MGPGPVCGLSPLDKPPHRPDHSQHQHHHDLQSASIGLWRGDYQPRSEYQVLGGYAEKTKICMRSNCCSSSLTLFSSQSLSEFWSQWHQNYWNLGFYRPSPIFNSFNPPTDTFSTSEIMLSFPQKSFLIPSIKCKIFQK